MGGPPNGPSDDGWHAGNGPQATPAHGTDFGRPPSLGSDPYGGYDQGEPPSWSHAPAKKRRRIGRTLLVLFGLLVVVGGAAAGAYIYFFNDDLDDLAASEGSTSVSAPAGDDSAGADTTTADDTSQTTTVTSSPVDDGTSETAADTTGEATTTAPVDPATQVADFRAILVQNELTSDNLTDEQVITIGNQLCIFAMASTDREGFEAFRSQAINEVDSDRTPEELVLVTNVAVIVFCPDEAQRLGIAAS
jgi:hypothetical protein